MWFCLTGHTSDPHLCRTGSERKGTKILELRDETYRELADIKDFSIGQLTIGLSHTRGRMILPEILPCYKERFPNIDLRLVEGNSSTLASALLHGDVDLVIDMQPFKAENTETIPLCEEEILLCSARCCFGADLSWPSGRNQRAVKTAHGSDPAQRLPVSSD